MCQFASSTAFSDTRLPFDAQPLTSSTPTVTVDSFGDAESLHHRRRRLDADDRNNDLDSDVTAISAFRPYSCMTASIPCSSSTYRHLDGAESQPLDLRKRADSSPPTSSTTLQFLPIRSSVDGDYTTKLTTNVVKADHHSVVSSRGVLTTTTKTQTPSPKPRKGNYFLIDSLLTPAHSSDLSLDSKSAERAPVFFGCSVGASFENPSFIFDIPKRSRIEPERDVARAPAPAVLSPHRTNGQETTSATITALNPATPMKKPKREPDDNASTTMTPPPNICVDDEPQMSTPDDPVIHSPPSLGGQLMNGFNPTLTPAKMEEGMAAACASPDVGGIDPNSDGEARRRQKTCRVCGDHATGYNFNVITCESCKAFFRRNALRPKEFKCPYSEDCEINAVSRRFCQKCRLRKCFAVGMKKEWILNEEQLRRRKNSRLNNMANQQRQKQELARQHAAVKAMTSPLSISPMVDAQLGALSGRGGIPPLVSPAGQYSLMSPAGSGASDSPPSRPLGLMTGNQGSPDAFQYESNMMMQQRLRSQLPQATMPGNKVVDPSRQVIISMDEYHSLVQRATRPGEDEPLAKRAAYSPTDLVAPQPRPFQSPTSQMLPVHNISQIRAGIPTYTDLGAASSGDLPKPSFTSTNYEEGLEKMNLFFHNTIEDALKIDSPDEHPASASAGVASSTSTSSGGVLPLEGESSGTSSSGSSDKRLSYQLNSAELQALDLIQEAFKGMNDPMEQGRQKTSFLKNEKSPADIMNIMDVTMRRFVKMAKKLPAFNDLSQDGKFALLKGGMIEMLTVRGVRRFDCNSSSWTTPTLKESCEVSINMFDQLNADVRSEQKLRFLQFFKIFHEDIRSNDLVISMIMLIVLFSPRDCITDPEDRRIIARHHEQFCALLNRYLESLYGDDAHKLNEQLPTALRMLREISSSCGMLFLGTVNTSEAEPLPREFFKVE